MAHVHQHVFTRPFDTARDVPWHNADSPDAPRIPASEFAAWNARRDAVPPEKRKHLRDRFGDEDKLGTEEEAAYLAEVEERKKRGEYWG
ncbi:hypothetical protein [Nocardia sp. NPDC047038]|uniref:hypothetical protein n=1 Tax=Nocardia sp. NPDC047038 TaxID=3154338 RepID=UPI0033DE2A11